MIDCHHPDLRLSPVRLVPCAPCGVAEGTHRVLPGSTGPEPYGPCQSRRPGQGGLEDVQRRVLLTVQSPTTRTLEHLACPFSATGDGATCWTGLRRVERIDTDHGNAGQFGLVPDLSVQLPKRPTAKAAIHRPATADAAEPFQVLEHKGDVARGGPPDQRFGNQVQSLSDSGPFAAALPIQEGPLRPAVVGLFPGQVAPTAKMGLLDLASPPKRDLQGDGLGALGQDSVQRVFVGVQGQAGFGRINGRRLAADGQEDPGRRHR